MRNFSEYKIQILFFDLLLKDIDFSEIEKNLNLSLNFIKNAKINEMQIFDSTEFDFVCYFVDEKFAKKHENEFLNVLCDGLNLAKNAKNSSKKQIILTNYKDFISAMLNQIFENFKPSEMALYHNGEFYEAKLKEIKGNKKAYFANEKTPNFISYIELKPDF